MSDDIKLINHRLDHQEKMMTEVKGEVTTMKEAVLILVDNQKQTEALNQKYDIMSDKLFTVDKNQAVEKVKVAAICVFSSLLVSGLFSFAMTNIK